jgi:hypothetical protein
MTEVYDQWSLNRTDHGYWDAIYEGTEVECREYALSYFTSTERENLFLMDWEGREWGV